MDALLCALAVLAAVVLALRWWWQEPEHDLTGKVVLLTGAGGGLGRLLSLGLAQRGCRVACVDVASKPNEETAFVVRNLPSLQDAAEPRAKAYVADLSRREDISALVENVIKDFGQVDILVNCAGQLQGGAVWDMTDAQMDLVLDVNLRATMLLVKDLMPHMRARRSGHIVTVSSAAAVGPCHKAAVYSSSKAGVSHFMECLYHDLHHEGLHKDIHVTTAQPFFMDTFKQIKIMVGFLNPISKLLLPFLRASDVAQTIVKGIATRQHLVHLPGSLVATGNVFRLLPRAAQTLFYALITNDDVRLFPYHSRHAPLDADLMFELVSQGYPPNEDPEAVCRGLHAEYSARGKALPHDYAPYAQHARAFYSDRGLPVPEPVRKVFAL